MPVIPYHELIDPDSPALKAVKGAVVIVGDNTDGETDLYPTPVGPMKGFEIHAQILNTLLTGPYARVLPEWVQGLLSYLLNLAIAMAILRSRSKWTALFSSVALLGALLGVYGALFSLGRQTGIAGTTGGYLTTLVLAITARLLLTAQVLQRFIPPEVVSAVMAAGSARPRNEIATIIVTDIRGYTTLSETRTPVQILTLLNEYHSVTVAIYERHGGRALTYQGDAQIIAFLHKKQLNPSAAAIRAAYEMQKAVDILRERWGIFNRSEFDVGAAVCTGPLTIGEIGTTGSGRAEYTVIGETVRMAHKIQSLSQILRCNVLMDEASFHASKLSMHVDEFKDRQLEGMDIPVTLYGLRSLAVPGKKSAVSLGVER
ncbi:CHASE2 domain-containing protein [bacterium CPR1]|nr:CHASE2 domain-containing protein [bacterium CPR1]